MYSDRNLEQLECLTVELGEAAYSAVDSELHEGPGLRLLARSETHMCSIFEEHLRINEPMLFRG